MRTLEQWFTESLGNGRACSFRPEFYCVHSLYVASSSSAAKLFPPSRPLVTGDALHGGGWIQVLVGLDDLIVTAGAITMKRLLIV